MAPTPRSTDELIVTRKPGRINRNPLSTDIWPIKYPVRRRKMAAPRSFYGALAGRWNVVTMPIFSGRSAAWLAHQTGGLGVAGSNPVAPIRMKALRWPHRRAFLFFQSVPGVATRAWDY